MKEYKNEDVIVYWFPELCSHIGTCMQAQPGVFDMRRRPWIVLAAAEPEDIIKAVNMCPSGALRYSIPEGSSVSEDFAGGPAHMDNKPGPDGVKIKATRHGPIFVQGPSTVLAADGKVLNEGARVTLCGCGHSCNKPFCDSSHYFHA